MRIILNLKDGSDGLLALKAAQLYVVSPPVNCTNTIYEFEDGTSIQVRKNTASISAFEDGYSIDLP